MKLLLFCWNAYTEPFLIDAFKEENIDFEMIPFGLNRSRTESEEGVETERIIKLIKLHPYSAVFTVNFHHVIAGACNDAGVPYIAWCYDSPAIEGKIAVRYYETNRIFLFDSAEVTRLRKAGVKNVWYMPLAENPEYIKKRTTDFNNRTSYQSDISFVGQLYSFNKEKLIPLLPERSAGYINSIIDSQLKIYNENIIFKLIDNNFMSNNITLDFEKGMVEYYKEQGLELDFLPKDLFQMFILQAVTNKERVLLLTMLSKYFNVNVYSQDKDTLLSNAHYKGTVDYYSQMPLVFQNSKINLNVSLRCIEKGIPLRCLDILASHGLLLTNFQEDLLEFFENEKDIIIYQSLEEAVQKAEYYLSHDATAQRIRDNGYQKVIDCFNYKNQLNKIFKLAGIT